MDARTVLLVEDDSRVRRALRLALEDEGYAVLEAGDGTSGLRTMSSHDPDVVLLDLMLPDRDGFAVCRDIRRLSDVPIVVVSARTDSADIVTGLEAGADDYVTKPLVARELSARIRALLRRAGAGRRRVSHVVVGDLEIWIDRSEVTRDGEPVSLTRTEFRLLAELAVCEGSVCSREHLLDKVWGYDYFGDNRIVDVHIARLRGKIERDPATPRRVVTVRGAGYRLAG